MGYKEDILALPQAERLPYAMGLLGELLGASSWEIEYFMSACKLTRGEALMLNALNRRPGRIVTRDQLMAATHDGIGHDDRDPKLVDTLICNIRKKAPVAVSTVHRRGFRLDKPIMIPEQPPRPAARHGEGYERRNGAPWTEDEEENLMQMHASGSSLWAIADDLCRTERAVAEKLRILLARKDA